MLMFDSLNREMLEPYGCSRIRTPNFKRLARRSVRFDQCYAGSLPCMPARRELHTGRYNFLHRSWGPVEPFDDSMPQILKNNGVYTHLISDHVHYWEDGGATYHQRYNSWETVRGQEGDKWKCLPELFDREEDAKIQNKDGKYFYATRQLHRHDAVNRKYMQTEEDMALVKTVRGGLEFLDANIVVKGEENLPKEGLYTFVSNHPLGGQDGVALGYILGSFYNGKVKYMVNDLLMNLQGLAPLCIPINKTGKQAKDFPRMVEAGFASDDQLIMFPAGLCSRRQNGVIRDLDWKKTFVVKSVQAHRDVVPIHFEGRNSNFFYNLANICKFLGIKVNIAMLYLADEMLKNRHKTFTVTIGKPISWQTFDKSKTPTEWAAYVKDIVYKL